MVALPQSPWLDRTQDQILTEMLAQVPAGIDITPGSFVWDALAPAAAVLADAFLKAELLRNMVFIDQAFGPYLDARCNEHNVFRLLAVQALGTEQVTGVQGTVIPQGTQFTTLVDPNTSQAAIVFFSNTLKQIQPRRGTGTWQETDTSIVYVGVWNTDANTKYSNETNDTADIFFNGTQITIRFITGPAKGIVGYKVDGGGEVTHDLYAAGAGTYDLVLGSLSAANHDITIRVTGTKNGSASDYLINIDYYTVVGGSANITDTINVPIQSLLAGSGGNVGSGVITQLFSTLNGIISVTNPVATAGGTDDETDDAFRTRFISIISNPPASGNVADYMRWAREASPLVGGASVLPLWSGNGTVKVFVTDTLNQPASGAILALVQAYIDPAPAGTGAGKAPIGATVTVVAPTAVNIDTHLTLVYATGYDTQSVRNAVVAAIVKYLLGLGIADTVRSSGLVDFIQAVPGVLDYSGFGFRRDANAYAQTNIVLAAGEKAVSGVITFI